MPAFDLNFFLNKRHYDEVEWAVVPNVKTGDPKDNNVDDYLSKHSHTGIGQYGMWSSPINKANSLKVLNDLNQSYREKLRKAGYQDKNAILESLQYEQVPYGKDQLRYLLTNESIVKLKKLDDLIKQQEASAPLEPIKLYFVKRGKDLLKKIPPHDLDSYEEDDDEDVNDDVEVIQEVDSITAITDAIASIDKALNESSLISAVEALSTAVKGAFNLGAAVQDQVQEDTTLSNDFRQGEAAIGLVLDSNAFLENLKALKNEPNLENTAGAMSGAATATKSTSDLVGQFHESEVLKMKNAGDPVTENTETDKSIISENLNLAANVLESSAKTTSLLKNVVDFRNKRLLDVTQATVGLAKASTNLAITMGLATPIAGSIMNACYQLTKLINNEAKHRNQMDDKIKLDESLKESLGDNLSELYEEAETIKSSIKAEFKVLMEAEPPPSEKDKKVLKAKEDELLNKVDGKYNAFIDQEKQSIRESGANISTAIANRRDARIFEIVKLCVTCTAIAVPGGGTAATSIIGLLSVANAATATKRKNRNLERAANIHGKTHDRTLTIKYGQDPSELVQDQKKKFVMEIVFKGKEIVALKNNEKMKSSLEGCAKFTLKLPHDITNSIKKGCDENELRDLYKQHLENLEYFDSVSKLISEEYYEKTSPVMAPEMTNLESLQQTLEDDAKKLAQRMDNFTVRAKETFRRRKTPLKDQIATLFSSTKNDRLKFKQESLATNPNLDVKQHCQNSLRELEARFDQVKQALDNCKDKQNISNVQDIVNSLSAEAQTLLKSVAEQGAGYSQIISESIKLLDSLKYLSKTQKEKAPKPKEYSDNNLSISPGINRPLYDYEFGYVPDRAGTKESREGNINKTIERLEPRVKGVVILETTAIAEADVHEKSSVNGAKDKAEGLLRQMKDISLLSNCVNQKSSETGQEIEVVNLDDMKQSAHEQLKRLKRIRTEENKDLNNINKLRAIHSSNPTIRQLGYAIVTTPSSPNKKLVRYDGDPKECMSVIPGADLTKVIKRAKNFKYIKITPTINLSKEDIEIIQNIGNKKKGNLLEQIQKAIIELKILNAEFEGKVLGVEKLEQHYLAQLNLINNIQEDKLNSSVSPQTYTSEPPPNAVTKTIPRKQQEEFKNTIQGARARDKAQNNNTASDISAHKSKKS